MDGKIQQVATEEPTDPKPKPKRGRPRKSTQPEPPNSPPRGTEKASVPPWENPPDFPPSTGEHNVAEDLSDIEKAFVDAYMIYRNSGKAYRSLFPNCSRITSYINGRDIRNREHVDREITAGIYAQRIRSQITADQVLDEIARVAFSDIVDLFNPVTGELLPPTEIPFNTRKALAKIKVSRVKETKQLKRKKVVTINECVIEYSFWDKMDALGRLCRHLGLETEITPLDALLRMLPNDLSQAVRASLMTATTTNRMKMPSANGNGVHN